MLDAAEVLDDLEVPPGSHGKRRITADTALRAGPLLHDH
jgi:hypothetical protein